MTDEQFRALKATFPWTEHSVNNGKHTLIKLIDNAGNEVPLLTMTAFITFITARLAAK